MVFYHNIKTIFSKNDQKYDFEIGNYTFFRFPKEKNSVTTFSQFPKEKCSNYIFFQFPKGKTQ